MWRAALSVREKLIQHVQWQLGDGKMCKAVGQPWHTMWYHFKPSCSAQRRLVIADLLNEEGSAWDNSKLIQLFGFHAALYIAISCPVNPHLNNREDRLIFTFARNGAFTIKGAYQLLLNSQNLGQDNPLLKKAYKVIWNTPNILPKCRLFMWKVLKEALPVDHLFSTRLGKTPEGCALCGDRTETVVHTLFKCPVARSTWFASHMSLRADTLPEGAKDALLVILDSLPQQLLPNFAALLWQLWKNRCKYIFEGKGMTPNRIIVNASEQIRTVNKAQLVHNYSMTTTTSQADALSETLLHYTGYKCNVDASWTDSAVGGASWAYVLLDADGSLLQYQTKTIRAPSPFAAELHAVKAAVLAVLNMGITKCTFLTDCQELQRGIAGMIAAEAVDWRVYHDLLDLCSTFNSYPDFSCNYIGRGQNHLADSLAKFARISGVDVLDYTFPAHCIPVLAY